MRKRKHQETWKKNHKLDGKRRMKTRKKNMNNRKTESSALFSHVFIAVWIVISIPLIIILKPMVNIPKLMRLPSWVIGIISINIMTPIISIIIPYSVINPAKIGILPSLKLVTPKIPMIKSSTPKPYKRRLHKMFEFIEVLMPVLSMLESDVICRMKVADVKSKTAPAALKINPIEAVREFIFCSC